MFFYLQSVILILGSIYYGINRNVVQAAECLICGILVNPLLYGELSKRANMEEIDYGKAIFPALCECCFVVPYLILMTVKQSMRIIEPVYQMMVYFAFLSIIVVYRDMCRRKWYIFFCSLYLLCTVLGFWENSFSQEMCLVYGDFLTPVKEAALTYIILEVVEQERKKLTSRKSNIKCYKKFIKKLTIKYNLFIAGEIGVNEMVDCLCDVAKKTNQSWAVECFILNSEVNKYIEDIMTKNCTNVETALMPIYKYTKQKYYYRSTDRLLLISNEHIEAVYNNILQETDKTLV